MKSHTSVMKKHLRVKHNCTTAVTLQPQQQAHNQVNAAALNLREINEHVRDYGMDTIIPPLTVELSSAFKVNINFLDHMCQTQGPQILPTTSCYLANESMTRQSYMLLPIKVE